VRPTLPDSQSRWWVDRHGPPDEVLQLSTGPVPRPGPGQTLIRVAAAGVNFADGLSCEGTYQDGGIPPFTPGIDIAGTVVDGDAPALVGSGGRVVGTTATPHGSWSTYALANARDLYPVNDAIDDVTAVAAHIVFQTAWIALHHRARIAVGDTVVVQAAAGATGSAAVQVACAAGARVIAVAGGPDKVAAAVAAGAEVGLDHRTDDVVGAVRDLTAGAGADIAYDPVGAATLEISRRCLAFEGRLLVVGFASGGPPPTLAANHLLVRNLDAIGIAWPDYRARRPDLVADAQRHIDAGLASAAFTPLVAGVRPMTEASQALADLRRGTTVGKWVLTW
jgi:NADPH2:quinone reductase